MKRLSILIAMVLSLTAFAATAGANVFFDHPNQELDIKFKGIEYVFDAQGNPVTDTSGLFQAGLNMNGLFYVDSIQKADGHGNPTNDPKVYESGSNDAYIGVLSGLSVAYAEFNPETGSGIMYFTGGTLDWYYTADLNREDIIGARWDYENGGYLTSSGDPLDLSSMTPFLSYDMAYDVPAGSLLEQLGVTGYANIRMNADGTISADYYAYGDVKQTEGMADWVVEYFNNNKYGLGHDIDMHATLKWANGNGFFNVNDPALITTAATPEPGTFILMSLGLLSAAFFIRRQQKSRA